MLVLTRKVGESLLIGDEVEVTLVEVRGDSVKLGIQAPRSVGVWRKELVQEVARENLQATRGDVPTQVLRWLGRSPDRPSEKK
ncbi:MAG TPA: carbon storage regulator CsrA [Synergistaceae bacterium]|nr:MAG: hypothetical protein BWY88_01139 [Synergistetes bacterium ADurb.Bin520]HOU32321.1 carbon storage regulator CsrA [Synergistaceae bacterium]HQF91591.1 carbon storage regulator CsrA [Synergistaceae bacterium]HQH78495.1 carbon storage regulator CsrA [Synergistaceae bacterium]HQK24588.1 carbon storage regulator CsrA [Synergistaceae bacterium]